MHLKARLRRKLFIKEVALECAKNAAMGPALLRNWRMRLPRTTISAVNPADDKLARYALALPRKLLQTLGEISGKDVAEFGPGDHLATGFVMLALGARSYTCLDRFPGAYDNDYARGYYRGVQAAWPTLYPERPWPSWLRAEDFPQAYPDRVQVLRTGVEQVGSGAAAFDIVCSFAVGEHVQDVGAFAGASFDFLRPGGAAVHVVDFSQHYDWSAYGDEFLFLSVPDKVWHWMSSNRGLPNRVRYHEFLAALEERGFEVRTVGRRLAAIAPDPQLLLPRFRAMPMDSVRTLDATFVCRKPGTAAG